MTVREEESAVACRSPQTTECGSVWSGFPLFRHPLFALLGLRPAYAQHTLEERETLQRWARGKRTLVEIGVAEGVSALALRQVMRADGVLYLVDPFHLSRFPLINSVRRVAGRTVGRYQNGRVQWIELFSFAAAREWVLSIDFLFIDGDHSEEAVRRDWNDWSRFVRRGGIVALHDARTFPAGWTSQSDGPVKLVDGFLRTRQAGGWEIVEEVHSLVVARRCT